MIDFHSHILPDVDHGAATLEISYRMLQEAKKAGVTKIVATPHFYPHKDSIEDFLLRRDRARAEMSGLLSQHSELEIEIIYGAEVALDRDLLALDLTKLQIGNSGTILIEMPLFERWQSWMYDVLYEIESKFSLTVILAHVDRYSKDQVDHVLDMGFLAQINAESLVSGSFFEKRRFLKMCKEGRIHLIGSDAHDIQDRTYRDLILAYKRLPLAILSAFEDNADEFLC